MPPWRSTVGRLGYQRPAQQVRNVLAQIGVRSEASASSSVASRPLAKRTDEARRRSRGCCGSRRGRAASPGLPPFARRGARGHRSPRGGVAPGHETVASKTNSSTASWRRRIRSMSVERLEQAPSKSPGAHGGLGLVEQVEERAPPLPVERPHELQVANGRVVQHQPVTGRVERGDDGSARSR